ncbi:MAG: type II secretion system F family protein [Alistipes indistinctus]
MERGACLSDAMERFADLYDRRLIALLRVGEQTGRLPDMLRREGDVLTGELEHRLRSLGSLLEPVLILLVGLLVAVILIAMYLPMFRLGGIMG